MKSYKWTDRHYDSAVNISEYLKSFELEDLMLMIY